MSSEARPPDLLEERCGALSLTPFSTVHFAEPVRASASYPFFDLQDTSTTLVLCSTPEHPVQCYSLLSSSLVASYPWMDATTEAFLAPHALTFSPDGSTFVAGSKKSVGIFDVSRPGEGPINDFQTVSKRKTRSTATTMAVKGIVSALSIDPSSGILVAGTFSRQVGLYDARGQGACLGVFKVSQNAADCRIGGHGITQVSWSPSGRYLYVTERCSDGVMIYDIRKTGQLVSWLEDRNAHTNQRLAIDIPDSCATDEAQEIWAGGTDGNVRMWRNCHSQEGGHRPQGVWHAHAGKNCIYSCYHKFSLTLQSATISSALVHRSGSVIATCSGQRRFKTLVDEIDTSDADNMRGDHATNNDNSENSLKIWAL